MDEPFHFGILLLLCVDVGMGASNNPDPISILYKAGSSEQEKKARRRFFDDGMRQACWQKAAVVSGRHPERWRRDAAGNIVCRKFNRCDGCLCYEFDHIRPFSQGGETDVSNCQILQSRVNRSKSDKVDVNGKVLHEYSCNLQFTDQELDVIEMAVYGNVVRPGLQCRCKSIAETLATSLRKSKDSEQSCELPYKK